MDRSIRTWRTIVAAVCTLLLTVTLMPASAAQDAASVSVEALTTEHATDPIGLDVTTPRLGWQLSSDRRGQMQTAYRIEVASSREQLDAGAADVWDSGTVESARSVDVPYAGETLQSGERYHWRVKVWDVDGNASTWSAPAWWEMGLLDADEWQGEWIGHEAGTRLPTSVTDQNDPSHLAAGTQGQVFATDRPFDAVGGRFPTWGTTDSSVTLSLHRDGPDGELVAQERFTDVPDNAWVTLEFDEPLPAGTYHLEQSEPDGTIGWWSHTDDVYPHGHATRDGAEVAGDRTLRWQEVSEGADGLNPFLRRDFEVDDRVERARIHSTALGVYELYLNGERVGEDVFAPGWTDYDQRVQYQTYDVTDLVQDGANTIGAMLGTGWYAGHVAIFGPNQYGEQPWLLAQLELTYADGTSEIVATDGSWTSASGPILSSDMLMGETYDARAELTGWNLPGYDAEGWEPVIAKEDVDAQLVAQVDPPVRVMQELEAVAVTEPEPGVFVFDLGQNMVGTARLRVSGDAGEEVTLRHAEVLNPDGTLYTENLRSARATDTYTLSGDGEEVYEPHFTFHGFRYVEVTGYPGTPSADAITGLVLHTDAPFTGEFLTSDEMVNQLQSNITWGQRGNFLSIPTDTPARDERMGWSGDINVFVGAAAFNMDVSRFLSKWLVDLRDGQLTNGAFPDVAPRVGFLEGGAAGWGDAGITVPWTLWRRYGDTTVIEDNYEAMVRWIDYLVEHSDAYIRPASGYGDWLNQNDETPRDLIGTAYFAYSAGLLSEMARAIGRDSDADDYAQLSADVREAFNDAYVDDDGRIGSDSQTGYVLALHMDLVPDDLRAAAAGHLVERIKDRDWHLSTGFLGTRDLLPVLTDTGHVDVAYRLLHNETFPSWGYQIARGATTMWEHWDSIKPDGSFQNPEMNSFNHYAYGAVGDWLYRDVAGLNADDVGYRHSVIRPHPGGELTHAQATYESVYGTLASGWRADGDILELDVSIPANTTATVHVPAVNAAAVTEGDVPAAEAEGVRFEEMADGYAVFAVGSGTYRFTSDAVRGWLTAAVDATEALRRTIEELHADGNLDDDQATHLRDQSAKLAKEVTAALDAYENGDDDAGHRVARALRTAANLDAWIARQERDEHLTPAAAGALTTDLAVVADNLSAASASLLGAEVSLRTDTTDAMPGRTFRAEAVLENTGSEVLLNPRARLRLPDGWTSEPAGRPSGAAVQPGGVFVAAFDVAVPLTQVPARNVAIRGEVSFANRGGTATLPVHTTVDAISPVVITEAEADPRILDAPGDTTTLYVTVHNRSAAQVDGVVEVSAPDDWPVDPASRSYTLDAGEERRFEFGVASPDEAAAADLSVVARYGEHVGDRATARVTSALISWTFDTDGDAEGWVAAHHLDDLVVADGSLTTRSTGNDPYMIHDDGIEIDASDGATVEVTMQTSASSRAQVFWGTADTQWFAEGRSERFVVEAGDMRTYEIRIPPQSSPITRLRLDPLETEGDIRIDAIRVVR